MDKRIYRCRKERVLGGVISGAVVYFGWSIDPNIIRILYALIALSTHGAGIILYLIAWIVIPEEALS